MPLHTIVSVRFIRIELVLTVKQPEQQVRKKQPVRFIRIELILRVKRLGHEALSCLNTSTTALPAWKPTSLSDRLRSNASWRNRNKRATDHSSLKKENCAKNPEACLERRQKTRKKKQQAYDTQRNEKKNGRSSWERKKNTLPTRTHKRKTRVDPRHYLLSSPAHLDKASPSTRMRPIQPWT